MPAEPARYAKKSAGFSSGFSFGALAWRRWAISTFGARLRPAAFTRVARQR